MLLKNVHRVFDESEYGALSLKRGGHWQERDRWCGQSGSRSKAADERRCGCGGGAGFADEEEEAAAGLAFGGHSFAGGRNGEIRHHLTSKFLYTSQNLVAII